MTLSKRRKTQTFKLKNPEEEQVYHRLFSHKFIHSLTRSPTHSLLAIHSLSNSLTLSFPASHSLSSCLVFCNYVLVCCSLSLSPLADSDQTPGRSTCTFKKTVGERGRERENCGKGSQHSRRGTKKRERKGEKDRQKRGYKTLWKKSKGGWDRERESRERETKSLYIKFPYKVTLGITPKSSSQKKTHSRKHQATFWILGGQTFRKTPPNLSKTNWHEWFLNPCFWTHWTLIVAGHWSFNH